GAGKTTMLRQAVQDVESRIRKRGAGAAHARPLFIALHGPDLLAPAKRAADADASPDPGATPPESDAEAGAKKTKKAASAKTARAAAAAKKESETPAAKSGATPSAPPEPPPSEDLRHFLDRITSGLYVGAAQELALRFRDHVLRTARSAAERADWLELAADLQVQLDRQPDLDRLRDYWRRVQALDRGVLFENAPPHGGRGVAEVTALFSVGRAMRRFAGKTEASLASEASRTQSGEVSLVTIDGQNLLPPLIGLVTGVAIWSALPDGGDPMVKALTSLLTGFGAVLALKVTSRRTRGASQTWKETFIPDDDPGSLYRVLPGLIDRFRDFGLVPVFVVDELDKVPGLGEKINSLLGYMKQFVTERAFFCFVTNRSFYQQATAQAATGAYSTLHTRFGDSVFVRYDPEDFHKYLRSVIYVPETVPEDQLRKAQDAAEMLRYKLLCRSYLHPYDLRRELAQLQNSDGTMIFTDDELIGSGRLQREVAAQVAVEIVYQSPELREYVRDPVLAQTVLDALYYPIRVWRNGQNEIDLTQEGLKKHLIERTGIAEEGAGAVSEEQLVPDSLQRLLLKQVEKVMGFLCAPDTLPQAAQDIKYELSETMKTMLARLEPIAEKVSG
ncbi:MAG TPA: hypothetical protein VFO89_08010, partial [Thermoanaerobaculia bacterium]|nr:hypothetical protein [Thermoanaerobaculia bacterium]